VRVLVIDLGGTNVKLLATGQPRPLKFPSGRELTPRGMVAGVKHNAGGWEYEAVALGYPGRVGPDGPADEPGNLGTGWVGFDFQREFGVPVRVVNDAAMQALGGYAGGRMLYLGLGTGLGSAIVADRLAVPLELGEIGRSRGKPLGKLLGRRGFEADPEKWQKRVADAVDELKAALAADEVLLGGGNAKRVNPVPANCRVGGNRDAFAGGFRLWEQAADPHHTPASPAWRVVA
jgi:predicted NBD/HSP70 family sugar kinase